MPEFTWFAIFLWGRFSRTLFGVIALLRCRPEDVPKVIKELRRK